MKICVMTDSNSGITQAEGKQLGIQVLPMPFTIDGKEYKEEVNLSQEDFYHLLEHDADIFTSQPAVGDLSYFFDEALKQFDALIYIPMSSGLSGSCQTAIMVSLEDKYRDKVFVVDSQHISITQKTDVLEAKRMVDEGYEVKEIVDRLIAKKTKSSIYITVPTLTYLKKGGRITPAAATLAELLKIKPILSLKGEKIDKFQTARTMKKAKKIMIDAIKDDIQSLDLNQYGIAIAYSKDLDAALEFKPQVEEAFPNIDISIERLSLSVSCHTGPGSLALALYNKEF